MILTPNLSVAAPLPQHKTMSHPKVSCFTAGRRLDHKDSYIVVDQSYVQYIPPSNSTTAKRDDPPNKPILFIHGGGFTGAVWESTPDLRPGWAIRASEAGHPVFLLDAVDSGRSEAAPAEYRRHQGHDEVQHRTAKEVWERFRFGPIADFETRKPFEGGQFPVEHLDRFLAAQSARRYTLDGIEAASLADAITTIGACYVIAHSHGAVPAVKALQQESVLRQIEKLVLVEPGPLDAGLTISSLQRPKTMLFWGDYRDNFNVWRKITERYGAAGLGLDMIKLPDQGIKGNSHFPMSDRNSDEVIATILQHLKKCYPTYPINEEERSRLGQDCPGNAMQSLTSSSTN